MQKLRASIFLKFSSKALLFVLALLLVACAGTTASQSSKEGTATPTFPSDQCKIRRRLSKLLLLAR